jgi:general secretion pathway protein G
MKTQKGFTLIELIIVLTLIGILLGVGLPFFKNALTRAREAVLKENLFILRKMINQYYTDKYKYPASIQTLVDEGYLKSIPEDPITKSFETWIEIREDLTEEELFSGITETGITDVQSGSDKKARDGTYYNTW